jgi:hypothetical protein
MFSQPNNAESVSSNAAISNSVMTPPSSVSDDT